MTINKQSVLRAVFTLTVLAVAVVLVRLLWLDYMFSPWTRDGRVRANVVQVATDVSGLVAEVRVKDNQLVRKGDVLFILDPARFHYALAQADADLLRAEAQVAQAKAQMAASESSFAMKRAQAARRANLAGDVISDESRADSASLARQSGSSYAADAAAYNAAQAAYKAAVVARQTAVLNLARSQVRAPSDGYITNLNLYPGDFATAGAARMALIDSHSFWVYGYFEETKLPKVHVGDRAVVRLMSGGKDILGHVESLASGIADRDNPTGSDLLADVNPIFTWVRLAQRVPVRVHLDRIPADMKLAMGMTCTVTLQPRNAD
ncbi:p-hydroxybenzoic acid efflux pump subunit AaeA [Paraburkholderia kirstenboschensis]|jgi:multidrug resistance efflux pump|uniref:HlyD family efflux transporter periplasmic adaptor subunit n=1 Tax=Paraburkholderia kirstenboschensis TaxID=1245436 RepID=UPI000B2B6322|nr:HlyD family secretion protein [Paraburkholderia kirstenboschensis]CAD6525848.1 p-hydroxybenzoic acid efflux pump subunit AaeA [Paraburkholderia kirstenboschensis]